jgi:hypothetical protein
MRKDWDYVEFADYQSDMDGLANTARAAVVHAQREKTDMLRLLIAAAISSSGDLVIHAGAVQRFDQYDWVISHHHEDDTVRISVRPKRN